MSDALVIIPTYNEKENIREIIGAVFGLPEPFHLLIVDDNSPDGTGALVKELLPVYEGRLFLEERQNKSGLGTAYIHGFRWALQGDYAYIFEMDADFSHRPKDLLRLYESCKIHGVGMTVGSRYVKGGKIKNWPWSRVLMSYFASLYVRLITGLPIIDTTAGFVCYRKEVLQTIDLDKIRFVGYAFQIEMKYAAYKLGFRLKEVPITFIDRVRGKSKMSLKIFNEAFLGVIKIRMNKYAR